MEYQFREIEKKWQRFWKEKHTYRTADDFTRPKCYVLDMFPYPSGAGLHVGHPLGYIASDIYSRYKRLKGFNVLHPMGYDAFGLPAEQYALEHGVHPAVSTATNIDNFRRQLDNIGFCFDWEREVRTCDPSYYHWTQWIFLELFNSWYDRSLNKARPIDALSALFSQHGSSAEGRVRSEWLFTADEWRAFPDRRQQEILMLHRLAYCGYGEVNWCEALGTVLANDEVVNGVSERGGHPVVRKKLRQWYLRITAYADRLLEGLERVDFSDAMKEMQRNWIGKSYGAEITFQVKSERAAVAELTVYTTRPDTLFGVDFMVVAPELSIVQELVSTAQADAVQQYLAYVESRSERERMAEKKISGVFSGAYVIHPFTGREIPIWIAEYVLAGYGTGAIMAVPCGDERDFKFARYFNIPVTNIIGELFNGNEANPTKDAVLEQSGFLNGLVMHKAIDVAMDRLEAMGIGVRKVNYKIRDAAFSRQRYWGEPFPIEWRDGVALPLPPDTLPLTLPHVDTYSPGPEGEGPLANIPEWVGRGLETNTMPGYAGSSWYFLRYMDPQNKQSFCRKEKSDYWGQVDLYVGGTEHAVGHLLYSRMWTKFLYDREFIAHDEPFKKLLNQGMIQGASRFVYRISGTNQFVSYGLKDQYEVDPLHVDVHIVNGTELDTTAFRQWRNGEFANAEFVLENGKYFCGAEVEKMSKSKFNTVNPDQIVEKFGADTFRMYEMFLGPVEISKPWDTKGIEGVHRFLKKCWRLFFDEQNGPIWNDDTPDEQEVRILHKVIKKVGEDIERLNFNTAVSSLMIAVNEWSEKKCHKKKILEPLTILLAPYAPHMAEELYHHLHPDGPTDCTVFDAAFPVWDQKYVTDTTKAYPVSVNGKLRTTLALPLDLTQEEVENIVLQHDVVQKWLQGNAAKKIIYVKGKMINVVV